LIAASNGSASYGDVAYRKKIIFLAGLIVGGSTAQLLRRIEQMARLIRRAVIHRIAVNNRVSLAVAKHIYDCRSIKWKQRACEEEQRRQANEAQLPKDRQETK
jgi:hypothetical protein